MKTSPNHSHRRSLLGFVCRLRVFAAAVLALGLLPFGARAQSTWVGATDTNWGTDANWNPSGVPGNGAALTFGAATNYVVDLGGVTRTVGNTTFTNDSNYTLNHGSISIGAFTLWTSTNSTTTINADIASTSSSSTIGGQGRTLVNGIVSGTRLNIGSGATVIMGGVTTNTVSSVYIGGTLIVGKSSDKAQWDAMGSGAASFTTAGAQLIYTNRQGRMNGLLDVGNSGTVIGYAGLYFDSSVQVGQNRTLTLYAPSNGITYFNWFGQNASRTGTFTLATLSDVNFNQASRGIRDHIDGATAAQLDLIKAGTGALIYAASVINSYSGWTRIDGGALSLSAVSQLGTSSDAPTNLVLNGGTLRYAGTNATSTRGFTVNAGATSGIEVTNAAVTLAFTGTNTGNGVLVKGGAGTLELTGYGLGRGGSTIVSNGVLRLNAGGTLGSALQVASGARFEVTNGASQIGGTLTNLGVVSVANAAVVFQNAVVNQGAYVSDPSTNTFNGNFTVGPTGYVNTAAGDVYAFGADFALQSTNRLAFNMAGARAVFATNGYGLATTTASHTLNLTNSGAVDMGSNWLDYTQLTTNFAIGTLTVALSNKLTVTGVESGATTNALYVGVLDLSAWNTNAAGLTNTLQAALSLPDINVYYDKYAAQNAYLQGLEFNVWSGGLLIPIPEPVTLGALAAGLGLLALRRRARPGAEG